jgi:outer membrane protein OmpU
MKKVLFATTALIATAGIASAEVAVSGWAEMGVQSQNVDNAATTAVDESKTRFFQDYNVKFSMSGTTDGGLTFGANVELRDALTYSTQDNDNVTDIYISSAFGNLHLGNVDGAMDWSMEEVAVTTTLADNTTGHGGYMGDYGDGEFNGQILRYDNTFGDIGFAISTELQNANAANAPGGNTKNGFAVGAKYALDLGGTTVKLGAGYQTFVQKAAGTTWRTGWNAGDNIKEAGISANANFNGIIAKVAYTNITNSTTAGMNVRHMGVGLGYTMDALTIGGNWGKYDATNGGTANDVKGYGIGADYNLGGGAVVQAGYGNTTVGANPATNNMSVGLRLDF